MKKVLFSGLAALLLLAGCKDAKASLRNGSEVLMTIGSKSFTRADAYEMLMTANGAEQVYSDAQKYIAEQEVEVTDEMKENAQSTLDLYKSMYGDQFEDYLNSMGMTEEDYHDTLLSGLQKEGLTKKYIEDNYETLCATYNPIQAIVLSFSSEEDASKALSVLKEGNTPPSTAAYENNSTSSGTQEIITINTTTYDSAALSVIRSASPDDGWTEIPSTDGATFYVLRVVSNNPADYKEDTINSLSNIQAITSGSQDYYFRKYNFHVYDIDVYNGLKESHPDILIQDTKAPAETPAPSASPETEASAEPTAETK